MPKIEKPSDWFDQLPETVRNHPERVEGFAGTLVFKIKGEEGGDWTVDISDGEAVVRPGDSEDAGFSVKMKDTNFVKMMNGEISGATAFMTGKLKFKGDVAQAMKLRGLLFA